jgi:hypothetical protein
MTGEAARFFALDMTVLCRYITPEVAKGVWGMVNYLGKFAVGFYPPESALGIFDDTEGNWFSHCWREDYGPFETRDQAEQNLRWICGDQLVLRSAWWALVCTAGRRLGMSALIVAAACGLLLLVVRF